MSDQNIRLTFRGGGWVLVMTGVVLFAMVAWAVAPAIFRLGSHAPGDNETIESYAFDLSQLQLERSLIVPATKHRNMLPVMSEPSILSSEELRAKTEVHRNPFLVSSDLVVGVEIGDEVRAYPLLMLDVHELVNDVLGGEPIVVTWNWPSGHVAVYSRIVDDKQLQFAHSGLSGNGGLLMYGVSEEVGGEQLFSTLLGRAISGEPATLRAIPHDVLTWEAWHEMHPETTSITPDEQLKKRYRRSSKETYFLASKIYYPASPMPEDDIDPKTPVLAIESTDGHHVYAIEDLLGATDEGGHVLVMVDEEPITITVGNPPLWAIARDASGNAVQSQRALWFAWFGNHADETISAP